MQPAVEVSPQRPLSGVETSIAQRSWQGHSMQASREGSAVSFSFCWLYYHVTLRSIVHLEVFDQFQRHRLANQFVVVQNNRCKLLLSWQVLHAVL